jgi:uncharacterized coiled-coil protein SlyX
MAAISLQISAANVLADLAPETPQGRCRSRSPRRNVMSDMMIATMEETIRLQDQTIEKLQGKIKDTNRELVENAYRISYLEETVKGKDQIIAMHNSFIAGLGNFSKKS